MNKKYFDANVKTDESTERPIPAILRASFHGESWYQCSACGYQFEFYKAFFNNDRCPNCGKLLRL